MNGKSTPVIEVVGCDGTPFAPAILQILESADRIAGSRRLLATLPETIAAERIDFGSDPAGGLFRLLEAHPGERLALLASGDPLCCGIGGTLKRIAGGRPFRIHPAPTAFQQLFARLGEPWETATFFPLHNRPEALPFRRILQASTAILYGDSRRNARQLAAELIEHMPECAPRRAAFGCDLGLPGEVVRRAFLAAIAEDPEAARSLSVLLLLPDPAAAVPPLPLGLEDEHYEHEANIITHPEVRAIVLSKLRLIPGVLWDVGAGSGSVGLEAAGLLPALAVHAIERNPGRADAIERNRRRERCANFTLHRGDFLEAVNSLPRPDRIFFGGGGSELGAMLEAGFSRLTPGGFIVASAVMPETVATLTTALPACRRELLTVNVSRAVRTGKIEYFKAENPVTIAVFAKSEGVPQP